jgi:hypothetical protein
MSHVSMNTLATDGATDANGLDKQVVHAHHIWFLAAAVALRRGELGHEWHLVVQEFRFGKVAAPGRGVTGEEPTFLSA